MPGQTPNQYSSSAETPSIMADTPLNDAGGKKRKRVTRACDECRKKKVKCDGQQPCIHCTVYSYECTYDQPSNRKRMPDIRRVETKLKCAESVISALLPGVDVYSPSFNLQNFLNSVQKARSSPSPSALHSSLVSITKLGLGNLGASSAKKDINDKAGLSFENSSTPAIKREIDDEASHSFGNLNASGLKEADDENVLPPNKYQRTYSNSYPKSSTSTPKPSEDAEGNVFNTLYSPQSNYGSPDNPNGSEIKIILPPKHVASELIEAVWDNACVLLRFHHRPSFIRDLDLLYETDPDYYTNKQYKILPLVYSVMAVGVLFSMDKCEKLGFKDASEGYKYFVAARKLIDIADARDTYAIQSIVMMIIFLQCSARLSTCYSYIGVALRSALRAGLHRKVAYNFNPIELETRKRLFWTIRKMDIYVNAMLGLPRSISEEDFDQELPEEIDDENITEDGYFPQKEGKISSAGISNAHTRLITILSHIMKHIYPVKQDTSEANGPKAAPLYNVAHAKVVEMEDEIRNWLESLPIPLRPGAVPPPEYHKVNRLLHLALCHVQIVLYRPFIHYCSPKYGGDEKARSSALSCIRVSRTAMHIAHDVVSKKLLNGAYWFSIYTIFFSVACLVYYVHENPHDPEALEIRRDAELGKNALTSLKDSSMAAQRTYNLLNTLFEQLNRRTAKIPVSGNNTPSQSNASTPGSNTGSSSSQFLYSVASGVMPSNQGSKNVNSQDFKDSLDGNQTSQRYGATALNNLSPKPVKGTRGRPSNSARHGLKRTFSGSVTSGNTVSQNLQANNGHSELSSNFSMGSSNNPSSAASTPGAKVYNSAAESSSPASKHLNKSSTFPNNFNQINLEEDTGNRLLGISDFNYHYDPQQSAIRSNVPPAEPESSCGNAAKGQQGSNEEHQDLLGDAVEDESPHLYVPGIMDQVDAQLFGRFLPPYMLQQTQSMPLGGSSGPHIPAEDVMGIKEEPKDDENIGTNFNNTLDVLVGVNQPLYNGKTTIQSKNGIGLSTNQQGHANSNVNINKDESNSINTNESCFDSNVEPDQFGSGAADRRISLSSLFSKGWEELLGQHNELSGLNSFMTQ